MTEGISKERLIYWFDLLSNKNRLFELEMVRTLIDECVDIDPWLPIDERAKASRKPLLVKNGDDIDLCVWREDLQIWYPSYFEPTHYKEIKL